MSNNRQCGTCKACCEGWLLDKKLNMKPYQPCQHCTKQGCAIYANRPVKPCVEFKCGWLTLPKLFPEKLRPNNCGAIVILGLKWKKWEAIRAVPVGPKIPAPTLEWLMAFASEKKVPLIFGEHRIEDKKFAGWKYSGYGPPEFVRDVKDQLKIEDIFTL